MLGVGEHIIPAPDTSFSQLRLICGVEEIPDNEHQNKLKARELRITHKLPGNIGI